MRLTDKAARIAWGAMVGMAAMAVACADDSETQEPPKIYFASSGSFEIAPTDTLLLEPKIIYDNGCTYSWTDETGATIGTERELTFIPTTMKDYTLTFSVSNSLGSDSYEIAISVLLKADFSDLDNFSTKKSNVLAMVPDTLPGAFRWNDVEFNNVVNSDTTFWGGFAYSNRTSTVTTISNSAMGTAYATSSTTSSSSSDKSYMAVNAEQGYAIIMFDRAYSPKSVDIANDNFIYLASKFGYMAITTAGDTVNVSPAASGDYYTAVVEGLSEAGTLSGTSAEYKLVDCDYDNPAKYYRSSAWNTVDLTGIGSVFGLRLSVRTSLTQFPELMCIDNLRLQD